VLAGFLAIGAAAAQDADAGARAILVVVAAALVFVCIRICTGGLVVRPDALIARGVFWSQRVPIADVAGIAIEPVAGRRAAALAVVTHDGVIVPAVLATWRVRTHRLQNGVTRAARDVARVAGGHDVAAVLTAAGRLDHPAAFTVAVDGGGLVAVPAATPEPGLTPQTVRPSGGERLLGWETIFVVVAFVVPAAVSAVVVLVRDVAHVRALDEFELPLPHNPAGSLVLMLLLYGSTAVIVPIALLLLARTGVPPRELGLTPRWLRLDLFPSVGLLGGVWLANFAVALALSPLLRHALTSTRSDTHVPAYFVVYALFLSAVTAVNEEVVINGYLMTRLAQRGWRPWPSLWLSLALRTSYHAYYGFALLLTVPFGYLVTRSFQRTRRLGRPVITHFLYDAILLTVAVLTS
jgi:hypothetical protein